MTRLHLLATIALSAALLAPTPTASAAPEATDTPSVTQVRVGTSNIRAGVSTNTFEGIVDELLPRVDVAGLQEVNSHDKEAVLAGLRTQGWDYYRPDRFYGEQNPIVWDTTKFVLVSARSVKTSGETYIGDEYAGAGTGKGSVVEAHYVSVVRLVHVATGQRVSIVDVHLPPGAIKAGDPVPGRPRLFARYASELSATRSVVAGEAMWGKVFTLGDFNSGYSADVRTHRKRLPVRRFNSIGQKSMWATERPASGLGTHEDALIDQVFSSLRADQAQVASDITGSDHFPAVAWYTLPVA